jgi:hypothetical protein
MKLAGDIREKWEKWRETLNERDRMAIFWPD